LNSKNILSLNLFWRQSFFLSDDNYFQKSLNNIFLKVEMLK